MAEAKRQQLRVGLIAVAAVGILALQASALLEPVGTDPASRDIFRSARWPVVMWCLGWPLVLAGRPTGCFGANVDTRFQWSLGCLMCWVHIAVAFHLGHGWSHAAAWEHTRQTGGDGVFVNYTFALVWFADALWACIAFDSYRTRPQWLNWSVHGFIAFIVFNAAVVFGSWPSRVVFFAAVLVSLTWLKRAQGERGASAPG